MANNERQVIITTGQHKCPRLGEIATGPKVHGFDPDQGRWIFKGDKNPEHHFLRRGSKAVGPMS
jgi:hypothetical protein